MNVWIEQKVRFELQAVAREGFRNLVKACRRASKDIYVTSCLDGIHPADSLHYSGLEFDIRKNSKARSFVQIALGDDWIVTESEVEYHCAYKI